MEIVVGKTSGFCYGVKRAVEGATNEAKNRKGAIYCLGELVHNKQVIENLQNLGIKCIEKIDESNGITIIRAHGVPKEVYDIAKEKNLEIQDYTCPNVLKIHEIAKQYSEQGYFIFLLGNKNHPENIGTLSYCKNYYVIEEITDIEDAINAFKNSNISKLLLIAQTTYSLEKFEKIKQILENKINNNITFVIKNTICRATELRQKETDELSKKVDSMIIIGGKNSSNTKKLYEVAKKNCENSILIETVNDLNLIGNPNIVGIMAGASTPQESVDEVINFLRGGKNMQEKDKFMEDLIAEYKPCKDNLIQMLNEIQEHYGYVPMWTQKELSEFLSISMAEIYGVVTFYSRFSLKPKGKYNISVCLGTACFVKGSQKIMDRLLERLKIQPGETTEDGLFSIEETRCVGACGLAPVFTVNGEVYGKATVQKLDQVLDELIEKK